MRKVIIVSGGHPPSSELFNQIYKSGDFLIAADRGAEFFQKENLIPHALVGDFDSIKDETMNFFIGKTEIETYQAEKDFTDTEAAFLKAVGENPKEIYLLGCTGSRLDHLFGNLSLLHRGEEAGITCYLMDDHNKIQLMLASGTVRRTFGDYISFQGFGAPVEGFTIEGTKYPLTGYTLKLGDSRTVSNEFKEDEIKISFNSGIVMVLQTRD